jgi:hypothetical protein
MAYPVMLAVMLARLTAPSGSLPRCPTVKILETVREYWRMKVRMSEREYLPSVFASLRHVVWILPDRTASSHCFAISAPEGDLSPPSKADASVGPEGPTCCSPWPAREEREKSLVKPAGLLDLGGSTRLSRSRLRSSSSTASRSLFGNLPSGKRPPGRTVGRGPTAVMLGRRYAPAIETWGESGANIASDRLSVSVSEPPSGSSNGYSSRSRAREAAAMGEDEYGEPMVGKYDDERYEEAKGSLLGVVMVRCVGDGAPQVVFECSQP